MIPMSAHALIAPLGWLYLLGSLLMLGLAWRAIRNGVPLARSIFITMLATILAVFATDLYDMGLIQGGWWVNSGGTGMLIVWLGLMAVSLIRRTSDYRRQLEDAARRQQQLQRAADTDVLTGRWKKEAKRTVRDEGWTEPGRTWLPGTDEDPFGHDE